MTVSNEAFEAAKKVHDEALPYLQMHHRLRVCLEAAAPFIQAQALEDAADEVERLGNIYLKPLQKCTPEEMRDCNEYINSQPNTWLRARAAALRGQG